MNKNFSIMTAAIVAISLSSCTQEEELFVSGNNYDSFNTHNAVLFSTYLGQAPQSRAGVIGAESLKTTKFGVFAYYTGTKDFDIDGGNDSVPNFMCNQKVEWYNNEWTYYPVKYWPNNDGEKVSFFAYAPYASAEDVAKAKSGITSLPDNTTKGDPKIEYTMPEDPKDQLDLLYSGKKLNLLKENIDQDVQFDFNHAMTRIGFERVIEVDEVDLDNNGKHDNQGDATYKLAEGTTVTITRVSLSSTAFYKSGMLNLRSGSWDGLSKAAQTYTLTGADFTDAGKNATSTNSATKTKLNNEDKYLMIFPTGNTKIPVEITVEYNIITVDPNLPNGKSQTTSIITTPFEFAFAQGKYYNFVLRIGLTSAKVDVETNDWDTSWDSTDTEVVVNTPYNNTVCLIYDANGGQFANGSDQYIITSHVNNWIKEDGEDNEYNPENVAKFIVETFQSGDITPNGSYYFGGWTDEPTNGKTAEDLYFENLTIHKAGDSIFVEKTTSSASRTIYALWIKPESYD